MHANTNANTHAHTHSNLMLHNRALDEAGVSDAAMVEEVRATKQLASWLRNSLSWTHLEVARTRAQALHAQARTHTHTHTYTHTRTYTHS